MDLFTREIIGWSISKHHTKELVFEAFRDAVLNTKAKPQYFHSDQGSEYDSHEFTNLLKSERIIISMSHKSRAYLNTSILRMQGISRYARNDSIEMTFSPWENGYTALTCICNY